MLNLYKLAQRDVKVALTKAPVMCVSRPIRFLVVRAWLRTQVVAAVHARLVGDRPMDSAMLVPMAIPLADIAMGVRRLHILTTDLHTSVSFTGYF